MFGARHFLFKEVSIWEFRDKRNLIILQFYPEDLAAMLEYQIYLTWPILITPLRIEVTVIFSQIKGLLRTKRFSIKKTTLRVPPKTRLGKNNSIRTCKS